MTRKHIVTLADGLVYFRTSSFEEANAVSNDLDKQGLKHAIGSYSLTTVKFKNEPKPKTAIDDLALFGELSPFAY